LAASAEQLGGGLIGVEDHDRYDPEELRRRDGFILRCPRVPVDERLVDGRAMDIANEGNLKKGFFRSGIFAAGFPPLGNRKHSKQTHEEGNRYWNGNHGFFWWRVKTKIMQRGSGREGLAG